VVHEQVLAAVFGRDEAEALVIVEPLYGSLRAHRAISVGGFRGKSCEGGQREWISADTDDAASAPNMRRMTFRRARPMSDVVAAGVVDCQFRPLPAEAKALEMSSIVTVTCDERG
jgi:hypothetical protein